MSKNKKKYYVPIEKKEEKQIIYPVLDMDVKGKLILPSDIVAQINYLHGKVGKDEWSALLLYDVISGSPADIENFALKVKHIYLMDIGTAGSTVYEPDGDIVDIYDNIEEAMEWKTGHIHSHHDMAAYFSGTDMSELNDNVDKHNYYLSLIVNFDSKYDAKVAFLSDVKTTSHMHYTSDGGKLENFTVDRDEKHMCVIDMDIYYEYTNDFFYGRYNEVVEKAEKAAKAKTASYTSKYKGINDSFRQTPGFKIPSTLKAVPFEGDPKDMETAHVEKLARNVFSVTPELDEMRSVYQLLHLVANNNEVDREFYFGFLAQNLRAIIENFFDQELELDEMKAVIDEISGSMIRFANVPALDDVIIGITEVLIEFITAYDTEKANEAIEDEMDEAAQLQKEMLAIT
jgi:hypothetical protein